MNRPIQRVAVVVGVLFVTLILNLNWVQVINADSYLGQRTNKIRAQLAEYQRQRGSIVLNGSGTVVASSVATTDSLKFLRKYSNGPLYAPVTGYSSTIYGQLGIEAAEDSVLSGNDDRMWVQRWSDLLSGRDPRGGNVVLTINRQAQEAAYQAMGGRAGAVVAIEPATGAILAAVSTPSYDPNKLSSHDTDSMKAAWLSYTCQEVDKKAEQCKTPIDPKVSPMLNRAFRQAYPPGSVFKVVVSAAALKQGLTPDTKISSPTVLSLPGSGATMRNFGGEKCGDGKTSTMLQSLQVSCNTAFAQLGMNMGVDQLRSEAALFGIDNSEMNVPLYVAPSTIGNVPDQAALGQTSIGQRDVQVTPLQAAMISAAVANNGRLMKPYLVSQVQGPDLAPVATTRPALFNQVMDSDQAQQLNRMMQAVVANGGTGIQAQIPGITVAGKTGTADHGLMNDNGGYQEPPHAWFSGFAPANSPRIAVAVIIENGGVTGSETTGGLAAAPVARQVIQAYLNSIGVNHD